MKLDFRRIIALLLMIVIINGLMVSLGEGVLCAGELPDAHGSVISDTDTVQTQDSDCPCPTSPSSTHGDHCCAGDCGCPCHAPLASAAIICTYSPTLAYLFHIEDTPHIPQVCLDRFIPPQTHA